MNQEAGNGSAMLAKLLNQLNLPTLALILFMNGWGIKTTENKGQELSDEQRAAYRKLSQIYEAMDDFEKRQNQIMTNENRILENQTKIIELLNRK